MGNTPTPVPPRIGYVQSPGVGFATEGVMPPIPIYVRRDEVLQIQIRNSNLSTNVKVGIRQMMADGQVIDGEQIYTVSTNYAANTKIITLEEGYLLSVVVNCTSNTVRRGQCFVQVQLGRGNQNALQTPTMLLVQDYITFETAAAWPYGRIVSSIEGPGWNNAIASVAPGAGFDWNWNPVAGQKVRVKAVLVTLTTSATVANRFAGVGIGIQDINSELFTVRCGVAQPASTVSKYLFVAGGVSFAMGSADQCVAMPPDLILSGTIGINGNSLNLQAGDQYTAANIWIEEWTARN